MVIVDTTVWVDYFGGISNPHTSWVLREAGITPLGLTDLALCETLQGIRYDSEITRVEGILLSSIPGDRVSLWLPPTTPGPCADEV